MKKFRTDQAGHLLLPIIVGVLVIGAASTVAFSRVRHNQLDKASKASETSLQQAIADKQKKIAAKEEQKEDNEVTLPKTEPTAPVAPQPAPKPVPKPAPKPAPKPTPESKPKPTPPSGSLSLTHVSGKNVGWTTSGSAPYGVKLVWSTSPGPVYPGSSAKYYSETATTSATIDAGSGNYYVRVCMYYEGTCVNYSNELYINVP